MDDLFRPSAVPVKGEALVDYHDAANPDDDPQIEASRRLPQRHARPRRRISLTEREASRPRRRISITEREEQAAATAANNDAASAEGPLQQLNVEDAVPSELPTSSDLKSSKRSYHRSNTGGSSLAFSYKDLYGSDDEHYESSAADNVVEFEQGETNFSNRLGNRFRRSDTSESGLSGASSCNGDSMVSVSMPSGSDRSNGNVEFDSIGGLISDLDDYYNQTRKQNENQGDECRNDRISSSESMEGAAKNSYEPQDSLLKSAVSSLKQLQIFRTNSAENISTLRPQNLKFQRLDGELAMQENNHEDESDQPDAGAGASLHRPLHLTSPKDAAKQTGGRDHSVSDSSMYRRKSSGSIPFFDRFQKQNLSKPDTEKCDAKVTPTSNTQDVDDDTPSTNSSSCPSPDLAPNQKLVGEASQLALLESMALEAQLESNGMDSNSQPTHTTSIGNKASLDGSAMTEIFSAALSNDEDGTRETMGEDKKAVIIDQLQLLAKNESVRSLLRETQTDDDASSPRFRPSIVKDFHTASKRESFHRKVTNEFSTADSQDTLDWPSPVSSLASPRDRVEENSTQSEETGDASNEMDDVQKETDSADNQSMRSNEEGSIELDLSGRDTEKSNVDHGNSLEASIEWPPLDTSDSKRSYDATAHRNAISKTASARSLVQSFRRQSSFASLKAAMIKDTKPEKLDTEPAVEVVEGSDEVKAENSEKTEAAISNTLQESGTNQDADLHTPSYSSSRPSQASSRPSYASSRMSSSSSHRSSRLFGREKRPFRQSDASMSSLESFASATNRASMSRGNFASVQSQEQMSPLGSVTSDMIKNEDKKDDDTDDQEEYTVSIKDMNESPSNIVNYPLGTRQLSRNLTKKADCRTSDGSLCIEDFDGNSFSSGHPSGLANDVPLLLSSATSLISHYSTDGIEHIDPSAADSDDFDFAMNAYADGMKYGHFDVQADLNADCATDNDRLLAAKAYMGLGFARQCRGELASSLDAYMKALELCNEEIGHDDPVNANLHYACGNVLNEMERNLEASTHFRQALNFYKSRESDGNEAKVNISFVEGMMFIALGDKQRALECFREGLCFNQTCQRPLNLKLASVMHEMGSIYSQNGEYMDSAQYFHVALQVRNSCLGDSFVVARTHYSLGVTLASQEVLSNTTTEAFSHLETALRICEQEFQGDNLQTAVILHAMGVLKEMKNDFLAASRWFKRERDMFISLFGEDNRSVASISSDLGTCYYNVGKYEFARNMFQDALRIMTLSDLSEIDRRLEVADLLYKIASCHDSLCDFEEALKAFYKVKEIRQSHFGMENSLVIQTMLRIGNVLLCKGEASSALVCFGEVLGIGYTSDSINEIEIANALYGRGCAQFCGYQLSDAMKSFHDSLNWKLAKLGENDPGLACIFYQMAHVHLQLSENEDALTYFEEYVRLMELDPQLNLHDKAQICFTKGIISRMTENFEAALSLYQQALQMFDTLFGGKHDKIASIHFDIGCVESEQGNLEAAMRHFQICLFQRKQLLGPDHVDVADVLLHMASLYTKVNDFELAANCLEDSDNIWKSKLDNSEKLLSVLMISGKRWKAIHCYQEAEANFEQALEMAITLHGQKHELVADILLDLGELLQEISQTQQAFFCFDESIEIRSTLFGADSPSVAKAEYSKGVAHIFQGQFDEAAACLNRALTIRRQKLGAMDSAVGDTLNTIGFLQLKMGNIEGRDALNPLMEALEIRRSVGNMGKVVSTLQNILSLYKKRKDFESCIEVNSDILVVRQDEFGPTHERVAEAWMNLGNVQASAEKFVESRACYEEALRIRTLNHGYQHRIVSQVLFKIGSLSSRQGNFDDAKKFFEEYIRIRAEEESDPDEEMAQALTLMGDLQKETGEKSKAQINWMSAIEIYQQLGYEDDHKKIIKLQERQKSLGMIGLFNFGGFGRRESGGGEATRRKSSGSLADNLSVLGLNLGFDDNASVVSKLTIDQTVIMQAQQRS